MADINAILSALGEAIALDTSVKVWCQAQYSKNHTVYENCDSREHPPASACPLVIIGAMDKSGGLSRPQKGHVLGISAVVHDERKITSPTGVVRFVGGRMVEEFRQLVFSAAAGAILPGLKIDSVDTEYNSIDQFPFVSANMVLVLSEIWTTGASPFE